MVNKFTKSLLVLFAVIFSFSLAFAETGTETEANQQNGNKNTTAVGRSYTIDGSYIAGTGSAMASPMTSKGLKFRTGTDGNRLVFAVEPNYTITQLYMAGVGNYTKTDSNGDKFIFVTKVEVDGVEVDFEGGDFPEKGASVAGELTISNIAATQSIAIYFDNSNASGTQINASWSIDWSRADATQPTIRVSQKSMKLIPGAASKLSVSVDPASFASEWFSDNTAIATVAEDGTVTAVAPGTVNIINRWTENAAVADTTVLTVADFNVADYEVVKEYDFTTMGDITLTIGEDAVGAIWNEGNNKANNVFFCTNEGLENIAVQAVLSGGKGWSITNAGLFLAGGAGRCAAVGNLKAGQVIEIVYTGAGFYTGSKNDAVRKDDGAEKTALNEGVGRAIYKMEEDGLCGFELIKGNAVEKIVIYEEKVVETTATFNFADPNFRENVGETMVDVKGYIYNETFTAEGATLQITAGSAPSRIYVDANRGQNLVTYKEYTTLTFRAPKGKAITKIEFTAAGNSNINNFTATSGAIEGMTWTGNAEGVRFLQGGTSYLANAIVTMVKKDAETAALPAIEYVECANIAEFNALEAGTYAKVTLTDAEVIGVSADGYSTVWVQDATGGCWVQYTSLNAGMKELTKGSGFVYVVKRTVSGNSHMKEAEDTPKSEITGGTINAYTMVAGTIEEVNVAANLNKVVKIAADSLVMTSATAGKLYVGETQIDVTNGNATSNQQLCKIANWTKGEILRNVTVVAILTAKSATANQLLPISIEETPATATFDFADPNFRENIGETMTDVKGYIYNETFTAEGATLQITGGSAPSRIYVDNNRGQNLVTYKDYATLTFRAPEGKAITKIEFTAAGNSNINNFAASSGAIDGMVWTGNAEGVRFAQGGTSYLANAIVSMVSKNAETAALPAIEYVECENIAAFNALENGTYAKVTLTNAEISAISADGYSTTWIQDATGGAMIQYTSLNKTYLMPNTKLNGFFYVVKRATSGNTQMKEAEDTPISEFQAESIGEPAAIEGTIAEVNVAANLNKVVKITGAKFEATSATAGTLSQGDVTITVNNGTETANQQLHKIDATWVKEETKMQNVTIVAILNAKSATANQLLPISMDGEVVGIRDINTVNAENVNIYNLQGVRMSKLQKGVNIVNGTKIVVK